MDKVEFEKFIENSKWEPTEVVIQLSPFNTKNMMFGGCMAVVREVKAWGIQCYVQGLGENGGMGGQAYYRAVWGTFEIVGRAFWEVE